MSMTQRQVSRHYAEVARQAIALDVQSGGGVKEAACSCCEEPRGSEAFALYAEEVLAGLPLGALAASRGCGDPVAQAHLQPGETVIDLGSGGGIDALIAARLVGEQGLVYGLDMTPDMVQLARSNAQKASIGNVRFLEGDIMHIPLPEKTVDVVISNCVINFCDDKRAVLAEAHRVLKPGGRLVVSDIVAFAPIPNAAYDALCAITGCRRGISQSSDYERMLHGLGFSAVSLSVKTLYTEEVLREKALRKGHEDAFAIAFRHDAGSTCGSAIVRAAKEA